MEKSSKVFTVSALGPENCHISEFANPMTNSACFTPVNHEEAAWISAVYRYDGAGIVTEKVGNSPGASKKNYDLMFHWANNLFEDSFG